MQLRPQNKAIGVEVTKDDTEATDAGLALYPPEDGWRAVFDRFGERYGFYNKSVGLKDDPCNPRWAQPESDGVMERVELTPEYIEAHAARDDADRALKATQAAYEAARAAVSTFNLQVEAGVPFEHPKGSSRVVLAFKDGSHLTFDEIRNRLRQLEDQATLSDRDMERAEREWSRVSARCGQVIDRLSRAIYAGGD